jgi:hypothetical protein
MEKRRKTREENQKEISQFEDQGADLRIILRCTLNK